MLNKLKSAPVALFLLAPLVGEFFLGDFPVVLMPLILVLAPWYGAGALLIREIARRRGGGWPAIVLLALAWAIAGEGLLGQSLFNPDYADQNLLSKAYIAQFGMGAVWTAFVLGIHVVWSICLPIAIVELGMTRPHRAMLGRRSAALCVLLLVVGAVITWNTAYRAWGEFAASTYQLFGAGVAVLVLVAVALVLPRRRRDRVAKAPSERLVLSLALVGGGAFVAAVWLPSELSLIIMSIAAIGALGLATVWSRAVWTGRQTLALIAALLLTYGWTAPIRMWGTQTVDHLLATVSAVLYLGAELLLVRALGRRVRSRSMSAEETAVVARPVSIAARGSAEDGLDGER
ncbi:hypothetical protein [Gordonia sp. CPCC 205333]|uniref:hypothetical protein n=1 Tax=Gordonia sp. CPCC 205333 TaxID=3140790 RepID=UPI003AF3FB6D